MVVKGKPLTLKERWQKLKTELRGMTPREKLEHLWEYYKWVLLWVLAFVLIVGGIVTSIVYRNTETLLAGVVINVDTTPEGLAYLQDGYLQRAKTEGRQTVNLNNMQFRDPYATVEQTYASDVHENVVGMIGADLMDYLLYDDLALPYFLSPEYFADLRRLFTEEELAALGDAVVYLELSDTREKIPMAINIRDTHYYRTHVYGDKNIYISFSVRLPRKEACQDFWQYLKGGETELLTTQLSGLAVDVSLKDRGRAWLTDGFFEAQGYTLGDHRLGLREQSLVPPETGEDLSAELQEDIRGALADGFTDYALCDGAALAALDKNALLDLGQVLDPGQWGDALVWHTGSDGREYPVALDLSQTEFYAQGLKARGPVYLVFSANTRSTDRCKALLAHIAAFE